MSIGLVEVYTKPDCPYCTKAKHVLKTNNINFSEFKLNEHFTREIIMDKFPNAKSYPIIVLDGFHIGGYTQLVEKLNEHHSSTQQLLNEAITL